LSVSFKVTVKSGSDFKSDALNYRVRFLASEKIIFGPSILRCSARQCNRNLECSARRCNRNLESAKGASETRQLAIFPLATTTVGWVPDRTPAGPKRSGGLGAKRRVVRAGCRLTIELKGYRSRKQIGKGLDALCLRVYNH
jgi:hypothetical protein